MSRIIAVLFSLLLLSGCGINNLPAYDEQVFFCLVAGGKSVPAKG